MNYARKLRSQEVIYLGLSCFAHVSLTILDYIVYLKVVIVIIFLELYFEFVAENGGAVATHGYCASNTITAKDLKPIMLRTVHTRCSLP
jgi:hypothetical protein